MSMRCVVQGDTPGRPSKKTKSRHACTPPHPDPIEESAGTSVEPVEPIVDQLVWGPVEAPLDGPQDFEGLNSASVAQALIDLASTCETPEIRDSLERILDEESCDAVLGKGNGKGGSASRKPEGHPRVGSAHASVRTLQDRHAALQAMISTRNAGKQEKRDDMVRHFHIALSRDMPLLTQVCVAPVCVQP